MAAQPPCAAPHPQQPPVAVQPPYAVPPGAAPAPQLVAGAPPRRKAAAVATATSVALVLGRAAWWLDRVADGKRLGVLATLGFIVWAAREELGGIGYVLTLLTYTSLLYLLLLARFWWVRDSDGNWKWSTFSTRARVAITDAAQTIFDAQERSWAGILDELRGFLLALGTGLVVLGAPVAAIVGAALSFLGLEQERANFGAFVNTMSQVGTAAIIIALLTWFLKRTQRRAPQADLFKQAAIALRDTRHLPFVIDTYDRNGNGAPAELQLLLDHIGRWKPRHLDSEAAYEASCNESYLARRLSDSRRSKPATVEWSEKWTWSSMTCSRSS
jgi:hypothetical protein